MPAREMPAKERLNVARKLYLPRLPYVPGRMDNLILHAAAIALGGGGKGGGSHTLAEWYDPAGRELGLKRLALITLALAGVQP